MCIYEIHNTHSIYINKIILNSEKEFKFRKLFSSRETFKKDNKQNVYFEESKHCFGRQRKQNASLTN